MAHTYDPHADDLVTMQAAEPGPPGEPIPPPLPPVCSVCNDTHRIPARDSRGEERGGWWACTSCPTPCEVCRVPRGAFCQVLRCECPCHAKHGRPAWLPPAIDVEALPPLEDPPAGLADLAQIADNLGLTPDEAAVRLNANPLVALRDARDVLEAAVATEIASYGLQALTGGAIRAIARAAVSRQLELVDDVLNRPAVDVRTRLTADETGWL